ncbi:MAG: hypothetical protein SFU25_01835 [Candidatus Caenarcaniphilales bacterium]|nr:hypothetical protein [Candidatus Caenarcaniphilales bacterium]
MNSSALNKLLISCSLCLCLANLSLAENTDFRGIQWGATKEQVKKVEKNKLIQEDKNGLLFEEQLLNRRFNAAYFFKDNKLYRGVYSLEESFDPKGGYLSNPKNYLLLYNRIFNNIENKFGKPNQEFTLPTEDEITANELLTEIANGNEKALAKWNNSKGVTVTAAITGSKGKIKVLEVYEYLPKETKKTLNK